MKKTCVTNEQTKYMARAYEKGAIMRELEARYKLPHGAVYIALHETGVTPRAQAPRKNKLEVHRKDS